MTSPVLGPLRDSALEGPDTGSAIGWDLICWVLPLSVTDIEKLMFYSSCFGAARGTFSATRKVFWFALPVLMFVLAGYLVVENVARFF